VPLNKERFSCFNMQHRVISEIIFTFFLKGYFKEYWLFTRIGTGTSVDKKKYQIHLAFGDAWIFNVIIRVINLISTVGKTKVLISIYSQFPTKKREFKA